MAQAVQRKGGQGAAPTEHAGGFDLRHNGQTGEQRSRVSVELGSVTDGPKETNLSWRRSLPSPMGAARKDGNSRRRSEPAIRTRLPAEKPTKPALPAKPVKPAKPPEVLPPLQPDGLPPELPPLEGLEREDTTATSSSRGPQRKRFHKMKTHPGVSRHQDRNELPELCGRPLPGEPLTRARARSMPTLRAQSELTCLLQVSAMRFDLRRVQELIALGALVNAPVCGAAEEPSYVTMLHSLSGLPGHVDGQAPAGSLAILDALLYARANLNPRSSDGSTPLIMACAQKNLGAVARLLQWKADLSPFDDSGYDCLMWAMVLKRRRAAPRPPRRDSCLPAEERDAPKRPLSAATRGGLTETECDGRVSARLVQMLLDASNEAGRGLGHARPQCASMGPRLSRPTLECENWALGHSKGVLHDKDTRAQRPSLMLVAVTNLNHEAASVLAECGVHPSGLHEGVRRGSLELVRVLLSARADPLERDECGVTPMDIALEANEDSSMTDALREAARYSRASPGEGGEMEHHGSLRKKGRSKGSSPKATEASGAREEAEAPSAAAAQLRGSLREAQRFCRQLCRGRVFQGVMFGALLGALFIPDSWVLLNERSDALLDGILLLVLAAFVVELLVQMLGLGRAYMWSFFFYTDLIGACSLLLDLSTFRNMGASSLVGDNVVIIRAARAARLGATAGRFTKLVKLLRFLHRSHGSAGGGTAEGLTSVLVSRLSILVSCLIIILLVILPLFGLFKYPEQDWAIQMWAGQLADAIGEGASDGELSEIIQDFRTSFHDKSYRPHSFIWQKAGSRVMLWGSRAELRPRDERAVISGNVHVILDFAGVNRQEAGTNLAAISFTIGLMVGFTSMISKSVSKIALIPLESVLSQVRSMGKSIYRNVESMHKQLGFQGNGGGGSATRAEEDCAACETALLDRVVHKVAALSEITIRRTRPNDAQALQYLGEALCLGNDLRPAPTPGDAPHVQSSALVRELFRTDGTLEAMAACSSSNLCSWDFNSLGLNLAESCAICSAIIEGAMGKMNTIDGDKLLAFVNKAASGYLKGPQYHNWSHAIDVTHVLFMLLQRCSKNNLLMSWLEEFALLVSAVCHDIGHPGVTNEFLVQTSSDLAIRYNDTSPLENMHCARLFELVTAPGSAIFASLSAAQYREARVVCIEAILHTDNKHHVDCVRRLQMLGEMNSELMERAQELHARSQAPLAPFPPPSDEQEDPSFVPGMPGTELWPPRELLDLVRSVEHRAPLRNALLHFADISNPVRPFKVCKDWASVILEEFFAEGDLERQRGLPVVALHDREKTNLAFSQIGFIDFFAAPLVFSTVRLLAPLAGLAEQLTVNANLWAQEWLAEAAPPEEEAQGLALRIRRLEERSLALLGPRPGTSVCCSRRPSSNLTFTGRSSSLA